MVAQFAALLALDSPVLIGGLHFAMIIRHVDIDRREVGLALKALHRDCLLVAVLLVFDNILYVAQIVAPILVVSLSSLELVEGSLDVHSVLLRYMLNDLIPALSLRLSQDVSTLRLFDVKVIRG